MRKEIIGMLLVAVACLPAAFAVESWNALSDDAPVYTGPLQEGDLEPLGENDFEMFGTDPEGPRHQYRLYKAALDQPAPEMLLPYKLKIVDRDLAMEDFLGVDVPEELAQERYESYADMVPETVNGRTIHYVYVYHRPLSQGQTFGGEIS